MIVVVIVCTTFVGVDFFDIKVVNVDGVVLVVDAVAVAVVERLQTPGQNAVGIVVEDRADEEFVTVEDDSDFRPLGGDAALEGILLSEVGDWRGQAPCLFVQPSVELDTQIIGDPDGLQVDGLGNSRGLVIFSMRSR